MSDALLKEAASNPPTCDATTHGKAITVNVAKLFAIMFP